MKNETSKVKLTKALLVAKYAIKSAIEAIGKPGTTIEYLIGHNLFAARKEIDDALKCAGGKKDGE